MATETPRLQIQIIDAETGEDLIRDMNDEELSAHKLATAEIKAQNAEIKAKAEARASALAKLAALGLTEAEIASL